MSLITLDLDGTLLPDDTAFAAVLRENGQADAVTASDARYFAGEITLEECFWEQWEWVQGLTLADCHRGLRKAKWLADIGDGVRRLHAGGHDVVLLTDQPSTLTDYLGRWGLAAICSPVTVKEGRAVGLDARFDKLDNLRRYCAPRGIDLQDVVHVGNGSNDVPVWGAVGRGIAVFAEADVAEHADTDLGRPTTLLTVVEAILS